MYIKTQPKKNPLKIYTKLSRQKVLLLYLLNPPRSPLLELFTSGVYHGDGLRGDVHHGDDRHDGDHDDGHGDVHFL